MIKENTIYQRGSKVLKIGDDLRNEDLALTLAHAIGIPTLEHKYYRDSGKDVIETQYTPFKKRILIVDLLSAYPLWNDPAFYYAILFDFLVANTDRRPENIMIFKEFFLFYDYDHAFEFEKVPMTSEGFCEIIKHTRDIRCPGMFFLRIHLLNDAYKVLVEKVRKCEFVPHREIIIDRLIWMKEALQNFIIKWGLVYGNRAS